MINSLHHFEILTNCSKKLLKYFVNGYNFNLIATKQTGIFKQYLVNSNSINFLITSLKEEKAASEAGETKESLPSHDQYSAYGYSTSLKTIAQKDKLFYSRILSKKDTVFNAAFQVRDLDRILANCKKYNVNVLREKHVLFDENYSRDGYVECAIIESCVDGVAHSLFDRQNYKGAFLPGFTNTNTNTQHIDNNKFQKLQTIENNNNNHLTYFDHLTYATYENTSQNLINWYSKIFNMKRFKIGSEEQNDGLIVRTGQSGMNLKVINHWLCAETGVEFKSSSKLFDESFKFVISEPLPPEENANLESRSIINKNQISIFLDENDGPGIQHIGLFSNDIVRSVQESKRNNEDIKYYATPGEYYKNKDKIEEIHSCGLDVTLLKDNHILLDTEIDQQIDGNKTKVIKSYLLQVFTQPIFDKNTVFLELIQRVGQARGFGAGNIKALWNAVQSKINSNTKC